MGERGVFRQEIPGRSIFARSSGKSGQAECQAPDKGTQRTPGDLGNGVHTLGIHSLILSVLARRSLPRGISLLQNQERSLCGSKAGKDETETREAGRKPGEETRREGQAQAGRGSGRNKKCRRRSLKLVSGTCLRKAKPSETASDKSRGKPWHLS